jgi:hypothetical protein
MMTSARSLLVIASVSEAIHRAVKWIASSLALLAMTAVDRPPAISQLRFPVCLIDNQTIPMG